MSKKRMVTCAFIVFCVAFAASFGIQNVLGATLAARVFPLSDLKIVEGWQAQFMAQAQGGSGNYTYKWYSNETQIQNSTSTITVNATGSILTYIPTQFGSFNITCTVIDNAATNSSATTTPITLTVLSDDPMVQATPPQGQKSASPTDTLDSGTQGLSIEVIIVAVIVVVAVVGAFVAFLATKQRKSKKGNGQQVSR